MTSSHHQPKKEIQIFSFTPISEDHAVVVYRDFATVETRQKLGIGIFTLDSNQLVHDLPDCKFIERLNVSLTPNRQQFMLSFVRNSSESERQPGKFPFPINVIHLFDACNFTHLKTREFFREHPLWRALYLYNMGYYEAFDLDGTHLVSLDTEDGPKDKSGFRGPIVKKSMVSCNFLVDDDQGSQFDVTQVNDRYQDPMSLKVLKPNLLAEIHRDGITVYERDKQKTHHSLFKTILPPDMLNLEVNFGCYSPDGQQAYLFLSKPFRREHTKIAHLELKQSKGETPAFHYSLLGTHTLDHTIGLSGVHCADNGVLHAELWNQKTQSSTLVTLDHQQQFQVKVVAQLPNTRMPSRSLSCMQFTPLGRGVRVENNDCYHKLHIYESPFIKELEAALPKIPRKLRDLMAEYAELRLFSRRPVWPDEKFEQEQMTAVERVKC